MSTTETTSSDSPKLPPMPRIKTERLLLRPFNLYDAKPYVRLISHPKVLHDTDTPHDLSEQSTYEWINQHSSFWNNRQNVFLLITSLETREIVGAASLFIYSYHNKADLGYWIAYPHWGKGYATEANKEMVSIAFDTLNLFRLEANHLLRNPTSGRVLTKLGFTQEGILRKGYLKDNIYEDLVLYGQLQSDYQARKNQKSQTPPPQK